jgi:hypothetical protein
MLIWRVLCDGNNPFSFLLGITSLGDMQNTKRNESFVDIALASLDGVLVDAPVSKATEIRGAVGSSLQTLPENRNLETVILCLQAAAYSHVEL